MKKTLYIILGAFLGAMALNLLLLPYSIAPGGISGVASILSQLSGGKLPVGLLTLLLNAPLFLAGWKILGRSFAVKSMVGTLLYALLIDWTAPLASSLSPALRWDVLSPEEGGTLLLYALWGGIFQGVGLGLIFRGGATTGGTDILARLLRRRLSWISLGQLVLYWDIFFLFLVSLCQGSLAAGLVSGIVVFVSSRVIDVVEAGLHYAKQVTVITHHPTASEEIATCIMEELGRGVTRLEGQGLYTGESVTMLLCVLYNKQLPSAQAIVKRYDPHAFFIVSDVREVSGLRGERSPLLRS